MRIATPAVLSALTSSLASDSGSRRGHRAAGPGVLRRLNAYTLWAFNPQAELTTRYDRAA